MKRFLFPFLVLCGSSVLIAGDPVEKPNENPAEKPVAEAMAVLDALDNDAFDKNMGSDVTVEGTIINAFWVRDNVLMLTFREEKEGFIAVSFAKYREALDTAFDGSIVDALKGKKVQISGKITEFNYRPQIVIESADQVKLIKEKAPTPEF